MKCPSCGAAELIHDTRDVSYVYKSEQTTIPPIGIDDFLLRAERQVGRTLKPGKRGPKPGAGTGDAGLN